MSRLETMRNSQVRLRLGSNRSATFRGLKNWRNLGIVLVNIPFALVGVVIAVFAGGGELSLGGEEGTRTLELGHAFSTQRDTSIH